MATLDLVVNLAGDYDSDLTDQNFTLRSALTYAADHAGEYSGFNITFSSAVFDNETNRTISLNSTLGFSEALLNKTVTINGQLASGSVVTVSAANAKYRTITAETKENNGCWDIELSQLNLLGGTADNGGCICVTSTGTGGTVDLDLVNVGISGGTAANMGGNCYFYSQGGTGLLVENSYISDGTSNSNGGGIYFDGAAANNNLTILNSTLYGNQAYYCGGALYTTTSMSINVINSTITGNSVYSSGGALYYASGNPTLTLLNSIVIGNNAGSLANIWTYRIRPYYSIYYSNQITGGSSAVGRISVKSVLDVFADLAVSESGNVEVLAINGGTARTISGGSASKTGVEVFSDSDRTAFAYSTDGGSTLNYVIGNAGTAVEKLETDQLGNARGNDVGAVAADTVVDAPSLTVTTKEDVIDRCDGVISLREALLYLCLGFKSETPEHANTPYIDFNLVPDAEVEVSLPFLITTDTANAIIDGGTRRVVLDAGGADGIFSASAGGTVSLLNMTLKNGQKSDGSGGAVEINRHFTGENILFLNSCANYGGALNFYVEGDPQPGGSASAAKKINLSGCTFSGNTATARGGAFYVGSSVEGAVITASNLCFSGNLAQQGGALYVYSNATINAADVIFSGNTAQQGGALFNNGTVNFTGATFASASDTVVNNGKLCFSGFNTLNAMLNSSGTVTINSGATLLYTASPTAATITNHGTFTVDGSKAAPAGSSYATYNFAAGSTGTFTTVNGGFTSGNRVYYYCVVDDTMTEQTQSVVIEGVETAVVYGVNAFTSTAAAKAAHADQKLIVVNETLSGGDLGGGTTVLESGVKITGTLYGAGESAEYVDLTLNGASSGKTVLGGGNSLGGTVGNVSLTLTDATVDGFVYGGGQSGVTGKITTSITGETKLAKNFYGGNLISDSKGGEYTAGAISVDVTGGSFGGNFIGGSRVNGSNKSTGDTLKETVASVALSISGGEFQKNSAVFSGGYILGNGDADSTLLEITNGVTLTLKNTAIGLGSASGAIGVYGGALAGASGAADVKNGSADNAVSITVESGYYSNIFGGGWAEGNAFSLVSGNIAIDVKGGSVGTIFAGGNNDTSGAQANVTGNVVISLAGCTVNNVHAASKWATSKITGNTTVTIGSGVTGLGILSGWTTSGKDVVSGNQTLDLDAGVSCGTVNGFNIWEITAGKTLTTEDKIDLDYLTKLTLSGTSDDWTVATGKQIANLAGIEEVWFGETKAQWDAENQFWYAGNYKLAVEGEENNQFLRMSTIAQI